jgi:hypothetical protein
VEFIYKTQGRHPLFFFKIRHSKKPRPGGVSFPPKVFLRLIVGKSKLLPPTQVDLQHKEHQVELTIKQLPIQLKFP